MELKLRHLRDVFVISALWNIKAEETSIKFKGTMKLIWLSTILSGSFKEAFLFLVNYLEQSSFWNNLPLNQNPVLVFYSISEYLPLSLGQLQSTNAVWSCFYLFFSSCQHKGQMSLFGWIEFSSWDARNSWRRLWSSWHSSLHPSSGYSEASDELAARTFAWCSNFSN